MPLFLIQYSTVVKKIFLKRKFLLSKNILNFFFHFKIDNLTLDPDANWAKLDQISGSGSKFNVFLIRNTASMAARLAKAVQLPHLI